LAQSDSPELRAARDVVARLNDPDTGDRYERWVERARGCESPVHLVGISGDANARTGELALRVTTEREPDGVR
jgi:hypothetical protein